jgi:hypothetical protein
MRVSIVTWNGLFFLYIGKHLSYNDVIQYVSVSISSRILFLCVKNEIIKNVAEKQQFDLSSPSTYSPYNTVNTYNINSIHLTCHMINIRCVSFRYTLEIFDVYFGSNLVHVLISTEWNVTVLSSGGRKAGTGPRVTTLLLNLLCHPSTSLFVRTGDMNTDHWC